MFFYYLQAKNGFVNRAFQIEDLWEATVDEVIFGASNVTKTHLFVRNSGQSGGGGVL
jgi:hypothetical protein